MRRIVRYRSRTDAHEVDPLLIAPLSLFERVAVFSVLETRVTTTLLAEGRHPAVLIISERAANVAILCRMIGSGSLHHISKLR
jgi:hypothetical protein